MNRFKSLTPKLIIAHSLLLLGSCGSPAVKLSQNMAPVTDAASEPCWVKRPDCREERGEEVIYFVGQSSAPLAQWGRPKRESLDSAMVNAETQYARFLGVEVEASTQLEESFDERDSSVQSSQRIRSRSSQVVGGLIKVDEYFTAYQVTEEGEPLWTVYVLVKIDRDQVKRDQTKIANKDATKPNDDLQKLSPSQPVEKRWTAKVFNIDDTVTVRMNGAVISQCEFSRTCDIELDTHLRSGANQVELIFKNRIGFWTYGYEVREGDRLIYQGSCGRVWLYGCDWDISRGVVHRFKFQIDH